MRSSAARPPRVSRYATAVSIVKDEDGWYVATAPALRGCMSQGETVAQARANLEEAMSLYLEYLLEAGESLPPALAAASDIAHIDVRGEGASIKITLV